MQQKKGRKKRAKNNWKENLLQINKSWNSFL